MFRTLSLIAILIVIPVIGCLTLGWVTDGQESLWRDALRQNFRGITEERLDRLALKNICADPKLSSEASEVCLGYDNVRALHAVSKLAIWAAIVFPVAILTVGAICRKSRTLLLLIFRPGLRVSNVFVAVMILTYGAILVGSIYYGESVFSGGVHLKLLVLIGFATLLGIMYVISATFSVVKEATLKVIATAVTGSECPRLLSFVTDLARKIGTEPPRTILVGLEPNFFVTEASVRCLDGTLTGRSMYLSAPLCRILEVEELEAVIAHELGHYKGEDTKFSLKFFPVYRGAVNAISGVGEAASHSGAGGLALIPAIFMLRFFLEAFAVAENAISRDRELAADALASAIAGNTHLASALVKITAFSGIWTDILQMMAESLTKRTIQIGDDTYDPEAIFSNIPAVFAGIVGESADPDALKDIDANRIPHPMDSHPPLGVRLSALGTSVEAVRERALMVVPNRAANSLIDNDVEVKLSTVQQYVFKRNGNSTDGQLAVESPAS